MAGERMLIAQITDVHLGFEQNNPDERNRKRLDRTLTVIAGLKPLPDLLLVTGDLADAADDDVSYQRLREALAAVPMPAAFCMGNHDGRAAFARHFPDVPSADGFVQYALEDFSLRILMIDTLDDGRHSGGYCETRAAWLRERLAEQPDRPTLIALHHPPLPTGLSWMTENPDAAWIGRLREIVSAYSNVVGMVAGHLHRAIVTRWAGTTLAVCPSTAPQVALDLDRIDPEVPDDRPMIVADPPGFALHYWDGERLITHFETAEDHEVLARFDERLQPLVRMLAAEKKL
jgi:3',5'-cyclic AMP phosphodiesterase CpdA